MDTLILTIAINRETGYITINGNVMNTTDDYKLLRPALRDLYEATVQNLIASMQTSADS